MKYFTSIYFSHILCTYLTKWQKKRESSFGNSQNYVLLWKKFMSLSQIQNTAKEQVARDRITGSKIEKHFKS